MEKVPEVGDRITDKVVAPDRRAIAHWIGKDAFEHWRTLQEWIDTAYSGMVEPDWIYGGKKRGWALRYKKTRALCTLLPAYRQLSVLVVLGRTERAKFEERRYSWSPKLVKLYDEARAYPDGKWITIEISSADDRQEVIDLISMKRPPGEKPAKRAFSASVHRT